MKQGGVGRKCRDDRGEGWRKKRKRALETDYVGEKNRQRNEREQREERLLTSGYGACRYSAGRGK